jgi:hypothetical protein
MSDWSTPIGHQRRIVHQVTPMRGVGSTKATFHSQEALQTPMRRLLPTRRILLRTEGAGVTLMALVLASFSAMLALALDERSLALDHSFVAQQKLECAAVRVHRSIVIRRELLSFDSCLDAFLLYFHTWSHDEITLWTHSSVCALIIFNIRTCSEYCNSTTGQ